MKGKNQESCPSYLNFKPKRTRKQNELGPNTLVLCTKNQASFALDILSYSDAHDIIVIFISGESKRPSFFPSSLTSYRENPTIKL
jgi:hypothetical protein